MKSKLILCLALILSGSFNLGVADGNAANVNLPVSPAGRVYRSSNYGFQFEVPEGWTVRETGFYVAHYTRVFLTVNSRRPELEIRDWQASANTWEFGARAMYQQMQPGEVYVSFAFAGYPGPDTMRLDTVGDDFHALLATNRISVSAQAGLSCLDLHSFKRGYWWDISACLRDPVTEENRQKVMAMLESFRFVDSPVGNAAWAESLAWKELPEQIQAANDWADWPVVDLQGEQPASAIFGSRTVAVNRVGSSFSVKFILKDIGVWEYSVSADGKVQSKPPVGHAVGVAPSQLPFDLPGESKGVVNAYWVDPYVQASKVSGKTMVTWFSEDGSVKRDGAVSGIQPGFVEIVGRSETVRGVNEDWEITLPREPNAPGLSGYITSTPDSRVFFHERHPEQALIALDIYVHGKLANTVGPFFQYLGNDVALNEDGSAGLLIWKDEAKSTAQIVTLNTNGSIRFRVDCGAPVTSFIVAPGGTGALLRPNTGGTNQNKFMWFAEQGKLRSMDISPNPECVGWIPGSQKSLFLTSLGNEANRWQLIDWDLGKRLWDIAPPGDGQVLAIGLTPNLILFSVALPYHQAARQSAPGTLPHDAKEWIRTFYAVNVQDGSVVARWQAQLPHLSFDAGQEHFLQLGDKLFYVTPQDVTQLNLDDIRSKQHGWR
jgi:hypothetical protein